MITERADPWAEFREELKRRRTDACLNQHQLAVKATYSRNTLAPVEAGHRPPGPDLALALDRALAAEGELVAAFQRGQKLVSPPGKSDSHGLDLVDTCAEESADFVRRWGSTQLDALAIEQFQADTERLAHTYLRCSPSDVLAQARALRALVDQSLQQPGCRPSDLADLYLVIGQLAGVMAYASLDLGRPAAALTHTRVARLSAETIGDNELRAWSAGTHSLILRFQDKHREALCVAQAGLRFATHGTAEARLRCAEAQCLAQFGDAAGTHNALKRAGESLSRVHQPDRLGGVFTFPDAKVYYYGGSSLIWLPGFEDAKRAERKAETAIQLFSTEPGDCRSLSDELLAHIYLATARLNQEEVEGIDVALAPVLALPLAQRTAWHRKRIQRIVDSLGSPRFTKSAAAIRVAGTLEVFVTS